VGDPGDEPIALRGMGFLGTGRDLCESYKSWWMAVARTNLIMGVESDQVSGWYPATC